MISAAQGKKNITEGMMASFSNQQIMFLNIGLTLLTSVLMMKMPLSVTSAAKAKKAADAARTGVKVAAAGGKGAKAISGSSKAWAAMKKTGGVIFTAVDKTGQTIDLSRVANEGIKMAARKAGMHVPEKDTLVTKSAAETVSLDDVHLVNAETQYSEAALINMGLNSMEIRKGLYDRFKGFSVSMNLNDMFPYTPLMSKIEGNTMFFVQAWVDMAVTEYLEQRSLLEKISKLDNVAEPRERQQLIESLQTYYLPWHERVKTDDSKDEDEDVRKDFIGPTSTASLEEASTLGFWIMLFLIGVPLVLLIYFAKKRKRSGKNVSV